MIKLFGNYINMQTVSSILFDFFLLTALFSISVKFLYPTLSNIPSILIATTFLLAVGILLINNGLGFYKKVNNKTTKEIRIRGVLALCLSLALSYVTLSYSDIRMGDEQAFTMALAASVVIMLLHRLYAFHSKRNGFLRRRILVYGSGKKALSVGNKLTNYDSRVELVGYYTGLNEVEHKDLNYKVLTPNKTLTEHVLEQGIDEIVVALSERRGGSMPLRELLDCKLRGIAVVDMASHIENKMGKISRDYISVGNLIFSDGFKQGVFRTAMKRIFDIVFSLMLIILALPLLLLASILIVLESGGPLIYYQERVGLNGKLFYIYKLRSMKNNAEEKDKPVWALLMDDRITRVGRIIRKYRIDELPQLFLVLSGHMSLVGPRPERDFFVKKLTLELPFYEVRQSVKPGLTGWAQVRYHYGSTVDDAAEKLQFDLYYVKNNSLWLDFIVLFKTIGVVLSGKGSR
jgi:sugar transferase (PEP-CTERM system associated)